MSEPKRIATRGFFLWRVASLLAPLFVVLALLLPLTTLLAAALVTLTLVLGFPTCKSMLQQRNSRRITSWWLGLSGTSILALLAKWTLLAMPFPRYADYFPPEGVSPLRQAILDNASVLYWGASWVAVITTIAAVVVLSRLFRKILAIHRQTVLETSHL